ncbi:MAG TPA: DUF3016 domain-containing protein [Opitutaceae bacterium]|jgi:hypothetical protein
MNKLSASRIGRLALALVFPLAAVATVRAAHQPGSQKLTVNYPNWKNYTDIRDSYSPTDSGEMDILSHLKSHLERDAMYAVPDGDHLTITFSDIRIAGDYEPQRGGNWDSVRFMKSIWAPHFNFTWELADSTGHVVKQGSEHLQDLDYKDDILVTDHSDHLGYEDQMLRNWMEEKVH